MRLLVTAGEPAEVLNRVSALADWLNMPPWAVAHLPFADGTEAPRPEILPREERDVIGEDDAPPACEPGFLTLSPPGIRMTCLKRSADGRALILRLQETRGLETGARLDVSRPRVSLVVRFRPFEIKTLRLEKNGRLREVDLVREKGAPLR